MPSNSMHFQIRPFLVSILVLIDFQAILFAIDFNQIELRISHLRTIRNMFQGQGGVVFGNETQFYGEWGDRFILELMDGILLVIHKRSKQV